MKQSVDRYSIVEIARIRDIFLLLSKLEKNIGLTPKFYHESSCKIKLNESIHHGVFLSIKREIEETGILANRCGERWFFSASLEKTYELFNNTKQIESCDVLFLKLHLLREFIEVGKELQVSVKNIELLNSQIKTMNQVLYSKKDEKNE